MMSRPNRGSMMPDCKYSDEAALVPHYEANVDYSSSIKPETIPEVFNVLDVDPSAAKTALDLGCGDGRLAHWLARNYLIRVHGVDYSASRVAKAVKHATEYGLKCTFSCQDLNYYLEKCPHNYDLIAAFEVLEHLQCPDAVLKACQTILNPSGVIVGSVPLDFPYVAHLQVYKTLDDVRACLRPDRTVIKGRYVFCVWRSR
ncbi:MAG: class I SAM-dependent methyltransferase [Planctomycetota bacterium]